MKSARQTRREKTLNNLSKLMLKMHRDPEMRRQLQQFTQRLEKQTARRTAAATRRRKRHVPTQK